MSALFDISFTELLVLGTVALLVLGPEKLPGTLRLMGQWVAKIRRFTVDVRHQSGIDEVLRAEGIAGGLSEMRSMMRGGAASAHHPPSRLGEPRHLRARQEPRVPRRGSRRLRRATGRSGTARSTDDGPGSADPAASGPTERGTAAAEE